MADRGELSRSFGAAADVYEAGRPDYPSAAVDWLLAPARSEDGTVRVADVGAGTGKLSRVALALGADVVAIDPDAGMLAVLQGAVPGVPTAIGTAEDLPLPSSSVDAVLLGQAWHWVEPVAGSREIARVLRPGGVLGLVWNVRDHREPWVRRLTGVMRGSHAEEMMAAGDPPVAAPFEGLARREWRWSRPMTRAAVTDMVRSRSYVITASAEERARIEAGVADLLDEVGAVGDAVVELPYVTTAFRAVRPAPPPEPGPGAPRP